MQSTNKEICDCLLELEQLPVLPEMQALMQASINDDIDVSTLTQVIETSPAVTARVLGIASSAFYHANPPVRSVCDAIVRVLGFQTTRGIVVGIAASNSFELTRCAKFDGVRYWSSALASAHLCRELTRTCRSADSPPPDTAYLCGLLHNIGLLALTHVAPAQMEAVFEEPDGDPAASLTEREVARIGIDHRRTGAMLARQWHLPEEVALVMERHADIDYRGPHWKLSLVVGVAARIAPRLLSGEECPPRELHALTPLGVAAERIKAEVENSCDQVSSILDLAAVLAG